jgi:hypothetical protein
MDYVAQFLTGVARSAEDEVMLNAVQDLSEKRAKGAATGTQMARLAGLVQERLDQKIAM